MSASPIFSILDVPELVGWVAQYLRPRDLVQCMTVCKALAHHVEPYLWSNLHVTCTTTKNDFQLYALLRNRSHLRSIDIDGREGQYLKVLAHGLLAPPTDHLSASELVMPTAPTAFLRSSTAATSLPSPATNFPAGTGFFKLQSITVTHLDNCHPKSLHQLIHITFHSRYLTMLNIPSSTLCYDSFRKILLYTLSNSLLNLEQLILLGTDKIQGDDVLRFLQVCFQHRRLMTLKCWFTLQRTPPMGNFTLEILLRAMGVINNGTVNNPTSGHPGPSRLKDFRLPRFMEEYPVQKFLVPLLKHFGPGLERLGLSSPTDGDLDQLQQVCAENCRGLQHLATSYQEDLRGDLRKDMTISSIIRFFKRPGLKSLSMDGYLYLHDTKAILDALVDCHSQTVEQVDMLDCGSSLDVLKRLFVECKKLKRLWVMDRPTGSVDNQVRYYFQDNVNNYFIGPTWQCLEMRELCVHLNSYQNGHGRVVGQIGRMIKLETLGIGYNDPNLLPIPKRDRGPGCLAELRQLKNLKQLRHLFLMSEFWHSMGQAEVEFMIQHWPNLEKITFGFFPETLQEIRREPHWQWLKRNKPHIQYTWWSDHHNYIAQQL